MFDFFTLMLKSLITTQSVGDSLCFLTNSLATYLCKLFCILVMYTCWCHLYSAAMFHLNKIHLCILDFYLLICHAFYFLLNILVVSYSYSITWQCIGTLQCHGIIVLWLYAGVRYSVTFYDTLIISGLKLHIYRPFSYVTLHNAT